MSDYEKQGMANVWKGKEAVGGKLYFTEQELIHKPHKANIQNEEVIIKVDDIKEVGFYTNKIFGLSVMKNGLSVILDTGKEYKFVVNKRQNWLHEIERVEI